MDATERIKSIMEQRGWSAYRLSKNCGLSENTIATILKRNSLPSISTLEAICKGFGITMSEFFAEGEMVEMAPELKKLFDGWVNLNLTRPQKVRPKNLALGGRYFYEKIQF